MNTFFAIDENYDLQYLSFKSNSIGILEKVKYNYLVTQIKLKLILTISDVANSEQALRIIKMSEKNCLISNFVKTTIFLDLKIILAT